MITFIGSIKLFVIFSLTLLVAGCSIPKPFTTISANGLYPASELATSSEILINIPLSTLNNVNYVYLDTQATFKHPEFHNHLAGVFKEAGFSSIYTKETLAQKISKSEDLSEISSASDLLSLNKLAKLDENFLYVRAELGGPGGFCCSYDFNITVYDAISLQRHLEVRRHEESDWNFDEEVINPVVNELINWIKNSQKVSN